MAQNDAQRLAPHDQVLASCLARLNLENDQARRVSAARAAATAAVGGKSGGSTSSSSSSSSLSGLGRSGSKATRSQGHDGTLKAGPSNTAGVEQLVCIDADPSNASTTTTTSHSRGFAPMRMVAEQRGQVTHAPHEQAISQFAKEFYSLPSNYAGDALNLRNQSAPCKDEENTALFITGLPANCTHTMLLEAVTRCAPVGKVYAAVINAAKPAEGQLCAAAKIVFFNRAGAENCFKAIKQGRLIVGGRRLRVVWNRTKSAVQPDTSNSRVVLIRGPSGLVKRNELEHWFSKYFEYQTERVLVRKQTGPQVTVLEWRFGSFRAQAEAATLLLSQEEFGNMKLEWRWGVDPCA
ncbi:hypothetical protein BDP81DRAFT_129472 [Colletotrichum phormii]|uniref:RRM domain-containing protein n=1 Tax=Colletotrichum phormii TaxID=359342 RepID=A0AAI9ZZP1_9PEZI|nr:uncharacterized protein BDP81DRAFT_129472 [Colletotrichum phormii]KAK1641209.1 hypothetical protein BDP81DRAFT_129472 [Colletotrichum phormii]